MKTNCIFCKIQNGVIKNEILYTDKYCFVVKDIAPRAPVHLLVIPNKHIEELDRLLKKDVGKDYPDVPKFTMDDFLNRK